MTKTKRSLIMGMILWIIFIYIPLPGLAQTKLDIKTKIMQKYELHYFKEGVIELLKADGYKIGETGEDYSIWIVECDGSEDYCMDVELCKPSMFFWSRRIIASTKISFSIPQSIIDQYSYLGTTQDKESFVTTIILKAASMGLPGGLIAHSFYSAVLSRLYNLIDRDPTPTEMAECIYGAAKIREAARSMLYRYGK